MPRNLASLLTLLLLVACGGSGDGSASNNAKGTLRVNNTSSRCILTRLDVSAPEFVDDFAIFIEPGGSQDFLVPGDIEYDVIIQVAFSATYRTPAEVIPTIPAALRE